MPKKGEVKDTSGMTEKEIARLEQKRDWAKRHPRAIHCRITVEQGEMLDFIREYHGLTGADMFRMLIEKEYKNLK